MSDNANLSKWGRQGAVKRWGNKTLAERLWSHVDRKSPNECWLWKGTGNRYGLIRVGPKDKLVHRIVYELEKGPIPPRMEVCHSCDNGLCCNPDHLWIGSHSDNMRDMVKKGRDRPPNNKGRINPRKYSDELVDAIKKSHIPYKTTAKELSSKFGMTWNSIRSLLYHARAPRNKAESPPA